jgi:hypothetical protein
MKLETIAVESPFGVTLQQTLYQPEASANRLMVLLPGRGYTVHHPALAYMAYMGVENGYDVLALQYGFQITGNFATDQLPLLQEDMRRSMDALYLAPYSQYCVVGKSLGTPLAVDLGRQLQAQALILLTPIPATFHTPISARALALIGTGDPFYTPQLIQENPGVQWKVYPDLDHGLLKPGDWAASLDALKTLIGDCAAFLQQA